MMMSNRRLVVLEGPLPGDTRSLRRNKMTEIYWAQARHPPPSPRKSASPDKMNHRGRTLLRPPVHQRKRSSQRGNARFQDLAPEDRLRLAKLIQQLAVAEEDKEKLQKELEQERRKLEELEQKIHVTSSPGPDITAPAAEENLVHQELVQLRQEFSASQRKLKKFMKKIKSFEEERQVLQNQVKDLSLKVQSAKEEPVALAPMRPVALAPMRPVPPADSVTLPPANSVEQLRDEISRLADIIKKQPISIAATTPVTIIPQQTTPHAFTPDLDTHDSSANNSREILDEEKATYAGLLEKIIDAQSFEIDDLVHRLETKTENMFQEPNRQDQSPDTISEKFSDPKSQKGRVLSDREKEMVKNLLKQSLKEADISNLTASFDDDSRVQDVPRYQTPYNHQHMRDLDDNDHDYYRISDAPSNASTSRQSTPIQSETTSRSRQNTPRQNVSLLFDHETSMSMSVSEIVDELEAEEHGRVRPASAPISQRHVQFSPEVDINTFSVLEEDDLDVISRLQQS